MPRWTKPRWTLRLLAALAALACAATAWAGQVRVNVGGPAGARTFTPPAVSANIGDHVVWIWTGGSHTVTSGDYDLVPNVSVGDGLFNSGASPISDAAFSWRVSVTGTQPYYCIPDLPDMLGTLNLTASGSTGLSDFRITEIQFNDPANLDRIEIANLGADGDLGKYRLKVSDVTAQTLQIGASTSIPVPAGGRVVLHFATSGTNTPTDLFFPAIPGLPTNGSAALFVPSTVAAQSALTLASMLIDFVQWGAAEQETEVVAQAAGFWNSGVALTGVAPGHSIEFCGNPGEYGFTHWAEVSTPNFGSDGNCVTPSLRATWGRLKSLYR